MFTDEKLHRVEALIAVDNLPSVRLSESLGFTRRELAGNLPDKRRLEGLFSVFLIRGRIKGTVTADVKLKISSFHNQTLIEAVFLLWQSFL